MPEIRRDYIVDSEWIVISPERNMRPSHFKPIKVESNSTEKYPFCPCHEYITPPEILAYRKKSEIEKNCGFEKRKSS